MLSNRKEAGGGIAKTTRKRTVLTLDNWSRCPRCDSNRVQKISKWASFLALFGSAGCLMWVAILFPPLWIAVPVLIILAFFMLLGKDTWQCQDCKKTWIVKKAKEISDAGHKETESNPAGAETTPKPAVPKDKPQYTNDEVLTYVNSLVGFPEIDDKGMKPLRILDDVRLTGVTKEHEGVNPQDTIEMLTEGEEVFFKRVPMKRYPNATLVVDCDQNPIGWIPENFAYQEDIAKRLDDGTTVKGRVCSILGGENGKSYGITIDIARYEKKRVKKT